MARLFHDLGGGWHPLVRSDYDPYEMIECKIEGCPNYGMGLARSILQKMGCIGGCR